jgi:hypothetical protein
MAQPGMTAKPRLAGKRCQQVTQEADVARVRLVELIGEAHAEPHGLTVREIAELTGLSFGRVGQILREE